MLTIVMYHYVRDLPRTRYPRIKGRLTADFDGQLDHIAAHYSVCGPAELVAAIRGETRLPRNACLLTFDDGLADHYLTVFPRLAGRGWSGAFFPPAEPILKRKVLDVHKVHFLLAGMGDIDPMVAEVLSMLADRRREHPEIPDDAALLAAHAHANRFDPPKVIFLKRLLQHVLPESLRHDLTTELFARHVTRDEAEFAAELYLSLEQLREMAAEGMAIGGHGDRHRWLEHLSPREQGDEIGATRAFLETVIARPLSDGIFCYPYGSYDAATLGLLRGSGFVAGLTTRVSINEDLSRPFELARLDTNDLPTTR